MTPHTTRPQASPAAHTPAAAAEVTVVIVNFNGAHLLDDCLSALTRQQTSRTFDIVVVDNASSDHSLRHLAEHWPAVRVIANPDNRGFAGGNNTALRALNTRYAVLLNNDARPEPDWLDNLLAPFDEPGNDKLAAVTSKVLFAPAFLPVTVATTGFRPAGGDTRDLGVQVSQVLVDGVDVTAKLLTGDLSWGMENSPAGRFFWTRPDGTMLVPLPMQQHGAGTAARTITLRWSAETTKDVLLSIPVRGSQRSTYTTVSSSWTEQTLQVPAAADTVDVVNNAGSVVLTSGHGADIGFGETDTGQYDQPSTPFAACGCAVAFRTAAGRQVGWFDDDLFLYYEDTDLSWQLVSHGWQLRYEPTAVVRHIHTATSVEGSPTFTFYTERNRLLMLAKNAPADVFARELLLWTVRVMLFILRQVRAVTRRQRPDLTGLRMRVRISLSLLRLLPIMCLKRWRSGRTATVSRREIGRRLATRR